MPRPLQGPGHEFLMLLARTGPLSPQNLGVGRHEPPQKLHVFVIHVTQFAFAQKTISIDWRWRVSIIGHML